MGWVGGCVNAELAADKFAPGRGEKGEEPEVTGVVNLWMRYTNQAATPPRGLVPCTNEQLADRLCEVVGRSSYRDVSMATGFHCESVRRYMQANARIPATFIAAFAMAYRVEAAVLLFTETSEQAHRLPDEESNAALADAALDALRPMLRVWFHSVRGHQAPVYEAPQAEAIECGGQGVESKPHYNGVSDHQESE